jgi:hypothetical protein
MTYLSITGDRAEMCVLDGYKAVLAQAHLLEQLAERCGQSGAMGWLGYFLGGSGARWKRPCVVLFLRPGADRSALQPEDLRAAALFYQLAAFGLRTGAFSTDDWEGRRTIIAPAGLRSQVTAQAIDLLLQRSAHVVLATYRRTPLDKTDAGSLLGRPGTFWAENTREVKKQQIALGTTYEETLARFGKRTRINLRYYRKRLLATMKCEFVADACSVMSEDDLNAMNAASLNPVPAAECLRRYRASRDLPGGFLIGLRGPEGRWLSALGGWRQGATTLMYYQINASGYEKYSLNTVMRSYFLENEIERGTHTLVFYHGTNHPMSRAFDIENVCDLMVRRGSIRARMSRWLARLLVSPRFYTEAPYLGGSNTFFAAALVSDRMKWRPVRPAAPAGIASTEESRAEQ